MHANWLIPDWPVASRVRAVFTTRHGGVSPAPWDSLNLGDHVGDDVARVAANRKALQLAIGQRPVFLKQIHGADVLNIDSSSGDGQAFDACITSQREVACTIMVADCLPVLFATADGRSVGAAHAGWRGLAGGAGLSNALPADLASADGVLEAVYASIQALAQSLRAPVAIDSVANEKSELMAWLGPCIGPAAFEVGADVKTAFESVQPQSAKCFALTKPGKYLADLPALARLRLAALGVNKIYGNDGGADWCTVSNPSRFFSHRRDAGVNSGSNGFGTTGRMAACVWID